ncbi:MAG: GC-type dockerin domain-anchored protein [Phycisphaerales bacterium]
MAVLGGLALMILASRATAQQVTVPAQCNIYGAGHAAPPATCAEGPGLLPVQVDLPPGATCIQLVSVSGTVAYCASGCGPAPAGADGVAFAPPITFNALGGISGVMSSIGRALHGVFLGPAEPAEPAPPSLTFADLSYTNLSPLIAQQFIIGDGLTGTGAGTIQTLTIPVGATRFFLGFTDGSPPCIGFFQDNSGQVSATVAVNGLVGQPASQRICPTGAATLQVGLAGAGSPTAQWQVESPAGSSAFVDIPAAGFTEPASGLSFTAGGVASASLHVSNITLGSHPSVMNFRCRVTNACGPVFSPAASITVSCPNVADVAGLGGTSACDGQTTVDDIVFYLAQFFAGNASVADLVSLGGGGGPDGLITPDDLVAFLAAFFAGCP